MSDDETDTEESSFDPAEVQVHARATTGSSLVPSAACLTVEPPTRAAWKVAVRLPSGVLCGWVVMVSMTSRLGMRHAASMGHGP